MSYPNYPGQYPGYPAGYQPPAGYPQQPQTGYPQQYGQPTGYPQQYAQPNVMPVVTQPAIVVNVNPVMQCPFSSPFVTGGYVPKRGRFSIAVSFLGCHARYMCAEPSGAVICNRDRRAEWELFTVEKVGLKLAHIKTHHGTYLHADAYGTVTARPGCNNHDSLFHIIKQGHKRWNIKTHHGKFFCAEPSGALVANRDQAREWELFNVKIEDGSTPSMTPVYTPIQPMIPIGVPVTPIIPITPVVVQPSYGQYRVTLRTHHGRFLCAEQDGRAVANRDAAKEWEHFHVCPGYMPGTISLRSHHGKFLCAEPSGSVVCNRVDSKEWESWTVVDRGTTWSLRSYHGKFLCVEPSGVVIANRDHAKEWETFYVNRY